MNSEPILIKVLPYMCDRQAHDLDSMRRAIDDFGAATLALSGKGAQAYSQFIEARDSILELLLETTKNYRLVAQQ